VVFMMDVEDWGPSPAGLLGIIEKGEGGDRSYQKNWSRETGRGENRHERPLVVKIFNGPEGAGVPAEERRKVRNWGT